MPTPTQRAPVRHIVCLDGTWNNAASEKTNEDGHAAYKPTNVLKTARATLDADPTLATITLEANPSDGDSITIDHRTYTFKLQLADHDGHIQIADDHRKTLENLERAINLGPNRGNKRYSSTTILHPTVSAQSVPRERDRLVLIASETGSESPPYSPIETTITHATVTDRAAFAKTLQARGYNSRQPISQSTYYDIGVGGARRYPGGWNYVHQKVDKFAGGARAAGFEANIEDAYTHLSLNYLEGDELYFFGFSRGAACARGLANFIDWMGGLLQSDTAYYTPLYFDIFLQGTAKSGTEARTILVNKTRDRLMEKTKNLSTENQLTLSQAEETSEEQTARAVEAPVTFLGVWDSVLAIPGERAKRFVRDIPSANLLSIRHAIAIDEYRADFTPRIWTQRANSSQELHQRWFAGVHTDVGGGYTTSTLANIPLRWVLEGAQQAGLGLDWDFLGHYPEWPSACQHNSKSFRWKLKDLHWVRRQHGIRNIRANSNAGLDVHPSALKRIASDQVTICDKDDKKTPMFYRSDNLLKHLQGQPDLGSYLEQHGLDEETGERIKEVVPHNAS